METPSTPPTDGQRTALIPEDQNELAALATRVAAAWASHPELTLNWTTQAQMATLAADFAAAVKNREDLSTGRSPVAADITRLEAQMDQALKHVKAYVNEEWDDDDKALSYYPTFGLKQSKAGWGLPTRQQERLKALRDLVAALQAHGMGSRKFGKTFWQNLLTQYEPLVAQSAGAAQGISGAVGDKTPLLDEVRRFLSRFNSLLIAQTRTTPEYLALRRELGYLKEYN